MTYENVYYLVILSCAIFLPFFLTASLNPFGRLIEFIATLALIILYLVASARNDGIDFSNYYLDFSGAKTIPDIGYQFIVRIFNSLNILFSWFLFFIGCITIFAINRIAKFFEISLPLCLLFFLSHSAIVRDLSQMRVGFSIALFMIGLTAKSYKSKWIFYAIAILIHATALIGILIYESCCYIAKLDNKKNRIALLIILSVLFIFAGQFLAVFSFIDPRIDIYINWPSLGYGLPVDSFAPIYLHVGTLLIYALFSHQLSSVRLKLRPLIYLEYFGIVFFIAFSEIAIFAYRITNIITCLYFVLIAKSVSEAYSHNNKKISKSFMSLAVGYCVILILLMRAGNSEILGAMTFSKS